jgi:hypothetical protein
MSNPTAKWLRRYWPNLVMVSSIPAGFGLGLLALYAVKPTHRTGREPHRRGLHGRCGDRNLQRARPHRPRRSAPTHRGVGPRPGSRGCLTDDPLMAQIDNRSGSIRKPAEQPDHDQIQQSEQHSLRSCHDHVVSPNPQVATLVMSLARHMFNSGQLSQWSCADV